MTVGCGSAQNPERKAVWMLLLSSNCAKEV